MKTYINGFILNIQFFTVIPIKKEVPMTKVHIERAIRTFPLLGLMQGIIYAGIVYALSHWTNVSLLAIAFFLWLLTIIITGGIHLDGWMDTSDALFSFRDPKKRLEIMADPRIGAFGVLSVIVLLATKLFFIYEIIWRLEAMTYLLIIAVPLFGKLLMGMIISLVPLAKDDGFGHLFQRAKKSSTLWMYPLYVLISLLVVVTWNEAALIPFIVMFIVTLIIYLGLRKRIIRAFGGITGDIAGASVEGVESCLWMIVWLFHYIGMG